MYRTPMVSDNIDIDVHRKVMYPILMSITFISCD